MSRRSVVDVRQTDGRLVRLQRCHRRDRFLDPALEVARGRLARG